MSGRITIRKARIITSREAAQAYLSADDARLLAAAPALLDFIVMLSGMETASEYDDRTDGDGMSGDDAVDTVSRLIEDARALLAATEEDL